MADPKQYLKARVVVGNIKCRRSYHPDDKAFHSSEVPSAAREARLRVKQSVRPKILGTAAPEWNQTTASQRSLCERAASQLTKHDRKQYVFNFRAEVLPKPADLHATDRFGRSFRTSAPTLARTTEMPVHPSLEGKPQWDGTATMSHKEKAAADERQRRRAARHSKAVGKALVGYKPPPVRQQEAMAEARAARARASTTPSPRPVDPKPPAPKLRLSTTTSSRRYKTYSHSGTYGKSPVHKDRVWSCCLASDPHARGCQAKSFNPDAYNFVSM